MTLSCCHLVSLPAVGVGPSRDNLHVTASMPALDSVSQPPHMQHLLIRMLAAGPQTQLSPASSLHVALEVPALDVSLVDGRPQELLLLSMDGLVAEYHSGNSAGTAYTQVRHPCCTTIVRQHLMHVLKAALKNGDTVRTASLSWQH